jgi:hypothetical protein
LQPGRQQAIGGQCLSLSHTALAALEIKKKWSLNGGARALRMARAGTAFPQGQLQALATCCKCRQDRCRFRRWPKRTQLILNPTCTRKRKMQEKPPQEKQKITGRPGTPTPWPDWYDLVAWDKAGRATTDTCRKSS